MSDTKSASEPSIEEILGSIRRIIADDEQPAASAPVAAADDETDEDDGPLELTQKIDDDGTVIDLHDTADRYDDADENAETYVPAPATASVSALFSPPETDMIDFDDTPSPDTKTDPLMSNVAADATAAVMAKLARNTALNRPGQDSLTLEDMVKDMLRPMLRDWLDTHLPGLVQAMVERELDKISRRVG